MLYFYCLIKCKYSNTSLLLPNDLKYDDIVFLLLREQITSSSYVVAVRLLAGTK